MLKKATILLIAVISITVSSCDQSTTKFKTYQQAQNAQLFDKGWIPNELVNENIEDIFLKNNLDLNTCIFSFKIKSLPGNLRLRENEYKVESIQGIEIPAWWKKEVENCQVCDYVNNTAIAIDTVNYKLYGWTAPQPENILTKNVGKYPHDIVDFFGDNTITERIKQLTGDRYSEIVEKFNTQTPISCENGIYKTSGCKQHDCAGFQTTLVYDANNDNLKVMVSVEDKVQTFSEKGKE